MDVLADASMAISLEKEEDVCGILNQLRAQRTSPAPSDEELYPEESTSSESTAETSLAIQPWVRGEDELLRRLANKALPQGGARRGGGRGGPNDSNLHVWDEISEQFNGRTATQCINRWQKVLNPENIKGPWCPNEDAQLVDLVRQYGGKHWARIASMLPGRTGKQCRERWCNNLDPTLKKGAWTPEEDFVILEMHSKLGTRWAEIAKSLPGRSDNSVKNRWYSTCSRILRQQQEAADAGCTLASASHTSHSGGESDTMHLEADEHLAVEAVSPSRPTTPARPVSLAKRSGAVRVSGGSPRKRNKISSTPTPKRSSSGRPLAYEEHNPPSPEPMQKESWHFGDRPAQTVSLESVTSGGWGGLAVSLPQPGETVEQESALSAEVF